MNTSADLEESGGPPPPPPLEFSKYTVSTLSGGVFACAFQKFPARFARLLSYLFVYILSLPFDDFADCLRKFKVVHGSYTFFICAEHPKTRHIFQYTTRSAKMYGCSLQRIFKIVNFLHFYTYT